jgi:hypothetical protein
MPSLTVRILEQHLDALVLGGLRRGSRRDGRFREVILGAVAAIIAFSA